MIFSEFEIFSALFAIVVRFSCAKFHRVVLNNLILYFSHFFPFPSCLKIAFFSARCKADTKLQLAIVVFTQSSTLATSQNTMKLATSHLPASLNTSDITPRR